MRNVHLLLLSFLLYFISGSFFVLHAQDRTQVKKTIKKLTSNHFAGRGYVNQGDKKAANYLASRLKQYGLEPVNGTYFQPFHIKVNTLPQVQLSANDKELTAGDHFTIKASANSIQGKFACKYLPLTATDSSIDMSQTFLVGDGSHKGQMKGNPYKCRGFIFLEDSQPIWSVRDGKDTSSFITIHLLKSAIIDSLKTIDLQVTAEYIPDYQTQNVWGLIRGTSQSDSLIVIGAHYDHLGKMGEAIYHGANDNASGTAMVLELARQYAQNPPTFNILFVLFGAEEMGLLGSEFLTAHFPFDISKTKLMINLDMVGTGSDGITVVNGLQHEDIFRRLVHLNTQSGLLKEIKARGESCNSDHCPFSQLHVAAIFIYTIGSESKAYHIPQDDFEHLPLTAFDELFKLLVLFLDTAK